MHRPLLFLVALFLLVETSTAEAQPSELCPPPGRWVPGGGGAMCQCPDGTYYSLGQPCRASQYIPNVQESLPGPATLVCIKPVPRAIKQLAEFATANPGDEETAFNNINFLVNKYCLVAFESIAETDQEQLGNGCTMKSGKLRGELVYWSTCPGDSNAAETLNRSSKSCFSLNGQQFCE